MLVALVYRGNIGNEGPLGLPLIAKLAIYS